MEDIFDRVAKIASGLPEAEESTHYGTPAFKVRKRMFCRLHDKIGDALVVRVSLDDRELIMAAAPHKYFITPHYNGYPAMLVRLPAVSDAELREALVRSFRFVAPATLAAAFGRV